MRWQAGTVGLLALVMAPGVAAQEVTEVTGSGVTLYQPASGSGVPPAVGRVPTKGWGARVTLEDVAPAGTTQFVLIRYPGGVAEDGKAVPAGSYWVRKSAVVLKGPCAHTPVAPTEIDRRAATNGAGSFCQPGP